jgi:tetratricopeptide (TPR) repeat protein
VTGAPGTAAVLERAEALRQLGRLDEAERALREALAGEPDDPGLLGALGWVLYVADRHVDGLAAAEAATARAPQDARHHLLRAVLHSALGRHDDAVAAVGAAASLAPHDPGTARTRARVLAAAGRLREAGDAARHAVALAPESSAAHLLLADIADDLGDRRTARRAYEESLRLDPQNAVARHDLAVLDVNTRHPARALRGLVEAGTLDPTLPIVLRTITVVLWKLAWRLRMLFVVATVACVMAAGPSPDASTWSARVAASAALLVIGLLVWRTVRTLPERTRPAVRAALRTDGPLRFTYLAIAVCAVLFLAVAVTGIGVFAALVWLVLGLLGVLALVVGLARRFRRA